MSIVAGLCTRIVLTHEGRLGFNGAQVIESEAGVAEFDSSDHALILSVNGGAQRYATGLADALVLNDVPAVRHAVITVVAAGVPQNHRSEELDVLAARLTAGDGGKARFSLPASAFLSRQVPVRRGSGGRSHEPRPDLFDALSTQHRAARDHQRGSPGRSGRSVSRTVRWRDTFGVITELGTRFVLQLPPGRVLVDLARSDLEASGVSSVNVYAMNGDRLEDSVYRVRRASIRGASCGCGDFMPTPPGTPATGRRWTPLAARSAAACRWRTPSVCTARLRELAAMAGRSRPAPDAGPAARGFRHAGPRLPPGVDRLSTGAGGPPVDTPAFAGTRVSYARGQRPAQVL